MAYPPGAFPVGPPMPLPRHEPPAPRVRAVALPVLLALVVGVSLGSFWPRTDDFFALRKSFTIFGKLYEELATGVRGPPRRRAPHADGDRRDAPHARPVHRLHRRGGQRRHRHPHARALRRRRALGGGSAPGGSSCSSPSRGTARSSRASARATWWSAHGRRPDGRALDGGALGAPPRRARHDGGGPRRARGGAGAAGVPPHPPAVQLRNVPTAGSSGRAWGTSGSTGSRSAPPTRCAEGRGPAPERALARRGSCSTSAGTRADCWRRPWRSPGSSSPRTPSSSRRAGGSPRASGSTGASAEPLSLGRPAGRARGRRERLGERDRGRGDPGPRPRRGPRGADVRERAGPGDPPLPYHTSLKLTTVSKYYTPSGRSIQSVAYSRDAFGGRADAVADSLRRAYRTAGRRPVFDGKGIEPDEVEPRRR
jgi:hypothetical protein